MQSTNFCREPHCKRPLLFSFAVISGDGSAPSTGKCLWKGQLTCPTEALFHCICSYSTPKIKARKLWLGHWCHHHNSRRQISGDVSSSLGKSHNLSTCCNSFPSCDFRCIFVSPFQIEKRKSRPDLRREYESIIETHLDTLCLFVLQRTTEKVCS